MPGEFFSCSEYLAVSMPYMRAPLLGSGASSWAVAGGCLSCCDCLHKPQRVDPFCLKSMRNAAKPNRDKRRQLSNQERLGGNTALLGTADSGNTTQYPSGMPRSFTTPSSSSRRRLGR